MKDGLFPSHTPFLPWLPGETLFSLCSRHHRLWGHSSSWKSTQMLLGGRRAGAQHDFPSAIDEFVRRTDAAFGTAATIAKERTLLRYYRPFVPAHEVGDIVRTMRGPSVAHLKFRLGLLTSRFRANHPLKACETCLRTDWEEHGWVYWHLQHQFPGVWVCPWHGQPLLTSKLKSTGVERFQWHLPDASALTAGWSPGPAGSEWALLRLANLTAGLVEHPGPDGWLDPPAVQAALRARLTDCLAMAAVGVADYSFAEEPNRAN